MTPQTAAALAETISAGIAVARLLSLGLTRRAPALLTWLSAIAAINLVYSLLDYRSTLYFWIYLTFEPAKCVFGVLAVRELFALVFNEYPGIRSGGRWVMYAAVALSLVVSAIFTASVWSGTALGRSFSHLYYFETAQRSVVFALALVIVTIVVFLSKYPLHLTRNTMLSCGFFSFLFLSEALQQLIDSLQPLLSHPRVDLAESCIRCACFLAWALLLRKERQHVPAKITFSTPREEHLLAQLNALNHLMTRSARR
jgi:hypothetical protein